MGFLRTVAGYRGREHIRNQSIKEELNIFNIPCRIV
jgi:hypothetical protein